MDALLTEMARIENDAFDIPDVYDRASKYAGIIGLYNAMLMSFVTNEKDKEAAIKLIRSIHPVKE